MVVLEQSNKNAGRGRDDDDDHPGVAAWLEGGIGLHRRHHDDILYDQPSYSHLAVSRDGERAYLGSFAGLYRRDGRGPWVYLETITQLITSLAVGADRGALSGLKELYLPSNLIGNDGLVALGRALTAGALPTLQGISLMHNRIGDDGLVAFLQALSRGSLPRLQKLFVDIVSPDLEAICAAKGVECETPAPTPCRDLPADQREACAQSEIAQFGVCKTCG
ncbi:hypothetical protein EMIHUDRAFT_199192 [Emiliania huxleyi CCMP1516]|uniref:Distal membrane arm assembly complex 2-like protein n=2 Tax=Emiliania huxleyi TaxID=2903 RepID=A0A0D3I2G1_EMIH1|nr:hypothetical protein EMIHUDRAFT_199192 [Emiliania huxleyi CCMP1516]EOD05446.1 hypothetical protein EMIHUDRAFT_199192 [Emiliania huxleyi CCMP1516]|eukprot:XP_005757875.1 hypothetical protein EMIHUDRAFT_199192 [Emiliania huxleyi CCMP1516]